MLDLDLNSISYFLQVVQSGSFTQAAKTLGAPKSTVSAKVAELERALGVTLLTRTTRKLSLTEAGEKFRLKIQPALSDLRNASEEAAASQNVAQGRIKITALANLGSSQMIDAVARYRASYPHVSVELDLTDRMIDLVADGYDIAVRAGKLPDSTLISKRVTLTHFQLFASPRYLKENGMPKHPRDLTRHSCLIFSPFEPPDRWRLQNPVEKTVNVPISGELSANSLEALKRLAELEQGIALLPAFLCRQELAKGTLLPVLPSWAMPAEPLHIVYPRRKYANPRVQELLPFLEKALLELTGDSKLTHQKT